MRLWAADPHKYGPGKVHILETDDKTFCGKYISAMAGRSVDSGEATCQGCLSFSVSRPAREAEYERQKLEWEQRAANREAERQTERQEWFRNYNAYLATPRWRSIRAKVMERAGGRCEGCLDAPARQVHHLTYAHVGNELLFELRAVCDNCHEKAHA